MLRTWLVRDGLRRERAKQGGLPPQLIFGHASAAIVGLLCWAAFVASGTRPFAWAAVVLLMTAVCLGLCTVILWTPYPARKPGMRRSAVARDASAPGSPPEAPVAQSGAQDPPGREAQDPPGQGVQDPLGREAQDPLGQGVQDPLGREVQDPPARETSPAFEVTDEMISDLLADPFTRRPSLIPLTPAVAVPVMHGFAAMCTLLLAVMSAIL